MTSLSSITLESQLARTAKWTSRLRERMRFGAPWLKRLAEGVDFLARGMLHVWRHRRYYTATKLMNMALVNVQFALKTERVVGRPYRMKIESTNICNTKCQLCPTGIGLQGRPKGKMDFEQYTNLVKRFERHLVALDLSMWGDPLIVPDIYRMIRYAHDRRIWTYISSNLHAFRPGKGQAEMLVRSGLDLLTCSLHGASQETYERYQPGKRLTESIEKIRCIIDTRRMMRSLTPAVQLNFVVTRHNEHEVEAFRTLAAELECKPVFSTAAMNTRFVGRDKNLVSLGLADDVLQSKKRALVREWLPSNPEYQLSPYQMMLDKQFDEASYNGGKLFDCSWPWRQAVVNWDGAVSTCCGSFEEAEDMGNVFDVPFEAIWNGRKYRMARRSFRKRVESEQAEGNPCVNCPGFMV